MKKRVIAFFAAAAAALSMTGTAYAHNGDYWDGKYLDDRQKNMILYITTSAQTSLLNEDVYKTAVRWNNVSNNVHVSVIMQKPGAVLPSMNNVTFVFGADDTILKDYTGRTVFYDKNGSPCYSEEKILDNMNEDWAGSEIWMNTTDIFEGYYDQTLAAKKTFTHEVGHTLKLCHPNKGSFEGHTMYNGYPRAIMNRGFPNAQQVSPNIADHDRQNLIAKWGDEA